MSIAGQMQIDIFHGEYLRSSTSCPATLDSEYRPQRRLSECDDRAMSEPAQSHGEPDGCRRLALSQGCWIYRSDKNVSPEWAVINRT